MTAGRTAPRRRPLAAWAVASACAMPMGCVSSFEFEPAEGHPARADTASSAPPAVVSPLDFEPPAPAEGGSMDEREQADAPETGRDRR